MTDFDFTNIKATVTKEADVPKLVRNRIAVNPFAEHFAKSDAKRDADDKGQWLNVVLPVVTPSEKNVYGKVVSKALYYLRSAADNNGRGLDKQLEMSDDGTSVTVYFRSKVKTPKKAKTTETNDKE